MSIPTITPYTGAVPDKATMSKIVFANSINPYLNYINTSFVGQFYTSITELNLAISAINQSVEDAQTAKTGAETAQGLAEDARDLAQGYAQDAEDAVALLPMGSISNDVSETQAYPSAKVEARLAEVGASLMQTGDILYTVSPRTAPEYLPCSGQLYDHTIYSDLYAMLGDLPDFGTRYGTATALTQGIVCEFSSDATYFVAASSASPYWEVHKRSGDTFTKLSAMTTVGNSVSNVMFDPSDTYIALAVSVAAGLSKIFKRSGDSFSATGITFTPPTGKSQDVSWGGTSVVAFTSNTSPFFYVYSRVDDVFTKLDDPATLPASPRSIALNSDGTLIAVYLSTVDNGKVFIYTISGGVISYVVTLITNSSTLHTYGNNLVFSPNDEYLYVAGESPTLFKTSDWSTIPIEFGIGDNLSSYNLPIAWLNTTTFTLAVSNNIIATFKIVNGIAIMLQKHTTYTDHGTMYSISYANGYLAVCGGSNTPFHDIYKLGKALPVIPGSYIKTGVTA